MNPTQIEEHERKHHIRKKMNKKIYMTYPKSWWHIAKCCSSLPYTRRSIKQKVKQLQPCPPLNENLPLNMQNPQTTRKRACKMQIETCISEFKSVDKSLDNLLQMNNIPHMSRPTKRAKPELTTSMSCLIS